MHFTIRTALVTVLVTLYCGTLVLALSTLIACNPDVATAESTVANAERQKENELRQYDQVLLAALHEKPIPLPPEWQEVVTYLSDAPVPKLPRGWVSAIVNKGPIQRGGKDAYGAIYRLITTDGHLVITYFDGWQAVGLFDVGDLIVLQPVASDSGWNANKYQVIKKFAFIPRDPSKQNE